MQKQAIMVSMTHWDREHARPVEQFRWHLVYNVMDAVVDLLSNGTLPCFVLDGQTLPVEDYLAIRPEREADVARLVREDKLVIGPFFTTPDELIPGGEALVRNLLLGHRIAARFGPVMKIALNLDAFGHPAQMPQILAGFGIAYAVLGRGVGEEVPGWGAPFTWRAPNGSQVLSILHFVQSTADLPASDEGCVDLFRGAIAGTDPYDLPVVLVGNGGDGAAPRPRLPEAVAAFNAAAAGAEMRIGSLDDYFDQLEPLSASRGWPLCDGELHSARHNIILSGVYSARTYLKQANFRAERALFRYAEPMATAAFVLTGDPYPAEFLERALRNVLENHFHDTICGCSGDAVYRDAMQRYAHAEQIAQVLIERAAKRLTRRAGVTPPHPQAVPVAVFNPHPFPWDEPVRVRAFIPGPDFLARSYRVVDAQGNPIPCQFPYQYITRFYQPYFWRRFLPESESIREVELLFTPDLPALGTGVWYVEEGEPLGQESDLSVEGHTIENRFLRVEVEPDGLLTILDKRTGHTFEHLHRLVDEESLCGEYYHIANDPPDRHAPPLPQRIHAHACGSHSALIDITYDWPLPTEAAWDLKSRSDRVGSCPVLVQVVLLAGVPRVELTVEFDNRVEDHRLRAVFPTGLSADAIHVETPFAVVERPIDLPSGEGWADPPVPESCQQTFTDVSDGRVGLAVLNQGLPEIGARRTEEGVELSLTLLRAVGWIARLHPGVRHYRIPTPEAQCPGEHTFRYALYPHAGDWREGRVWEQAQRFAVPPLAIDADPAEGDGRPVSLFSVSPSDLVLSALKRAETGDDLIVRLWNVSPEAIEGRLGFASPVKAVSLANLLEEPTEALPLIDGHAHFLAPAHGILTLRVTPDT